MKNKIEKMALADIIVHEMITEHKVTVGLQHKVKAVKKHYEKGQTKPIEVVKTERGWRLVDGYARYCALTELGIAEYDVIKHEGDYQTVIQEVLRKKREKKEQREAEKAERIRNHELRMEQEKLTEEQLQERRKRKYTKKKLRKAKKRATLELAMKEFFWYWIRENHPYKKGKTKKADATAEYTFVCKLLNEFKPNTNDLERYFKCVEHHAPVHIRTAVIGIFLELWTQYYEEMQAKSVSA